MRLVTTQRVNKYGPMAFSREALESLVEQINAAPSNFPLVDEHDILQPIPKRNARATLTAFGDGEWAVDLEVEVPSDSVHRLSAGRGVSITHWSRLGEVAGPHPERAVIELAAEASSFSPDEIAHACELMCLAGPVAGYKLMEFAERTRRRLVLKVASALAIELVTDLAMRPVSSGIDYLLTVGAGAGIELTRIELVVETPNGSLSGVVETNDPQVAAEALKTYAELVLALPSTDGALTHKWSSGDRCWVPVTGAEE